MENKMIRTIMTPEEFIEYHNNIAQFKNYCEAIIYPNGDVQYAIPSHTELLLKLYCDMIHISRDKIWNTISKDDYSERYLPDKTGCMMLWYNNVVFPHFITSKQYDTLEMLSDAGCIGFYVKR